MTYLIELLLLKTISYVMFNENNRNYFSVKHIHDYLNYAKNLDYISIDILNKNESLPLLLSWVLLFVEIR